MTSMPQCTLHFVSLGWEGELEATRISPSGHRYSLTSKTLGNTISVVGTFSESSTPANQALAFGSITKASEKWWEAFWTAGAFIVLSNASDPKALELQRRTILSLYLTAVNPGSSNPPQRMCLPTCRQLAVLGTN